MVSEHCHTWRQESFLRIDVYVGNKQVRMRAGEARQDLIVDRCFVDVAGCAALEVLYATLTMHHATWPPLLQWMVDSCASILVRTDRTLPPLLAVFGHLVCWRSVSALLRVTLLALACLR